MDKARVRVLAQSAHGHCGGVGTLRQQEAETHHVYVRLDEPKRRSVFREFRAREQVVPTHLSIPRSAFAVHRECKLHKL